jgi:conjugal transfer mating pair stabilization protein TraG
MVIIHVLTCGDLFAEVLNAITAFMKQDSFAGLLRITAFAGIVMATVGYLKTRDPMVFGKWFAAYVLFINLALVPKTSVLVYDISSQISVPIDNVPVVFAVPASIVTGIGYGLAQSYDALLTLPDDFLYTHTGSLFASRLVQAARDFHIVNPELKEEMDSYFRTCVVGTFASIINTASVI